MTISSAVLESSQNIDKWLRKEPWNTRVLDYQKRVLVDIADILDISVEELIRQGRQGNWFSRLTDALMDYFYEVTFNDEPFNVVDDYLKRRGWKETKTVREYLQAVRSTSFSLYEVKAVKPGESITLVDRVRNLPAVEVLEKKGSQYVSTNHFLLAKVVEVEERHYFSSAFFLFLPEDAKELLDEISESLDDEDRSSQAGLNTFLHEFTLILMAEAIDSMLDESLPTVKNMQGESLLFTEIRFPIKDKQAVIAGLDSWPDLDKEEGLKHPAWVWLQSQENSKDSFTVLADITLQGKWLKASVNSKERCTRLLERLQSAFPEALGRPIVSHQGVESGLREESSQDRGFEPITDPLILNEVILPRLNEHYRQTLDTKIPMLESNTPREAVKTAAGRKLVVKWLSYLESNHGKSQTMPAYNYDWMWEELGLPRLETP